jgi:hypothetical protein
MVAVQEMLVERCGYGAMAQRIFDNPNQQRVTAANSLRAPLQPSRAGEAGEWLAWLL